MHRPLNEEEKRKALRDGAEGAVREVERRQPQLAEMGHAARAIFNAYLTSKTWGLVDGPMPNGMNSPIDELWSVTPEVTFEK